MAFPESKQRYVQDEENIVNEGFPIGMNTLNTSKSSLLNFPRTIHFLLKPVESGVDDYNILPPPVHLFDNLSLIPGRITLSQFESILVDRWSMNPDENVLSVRTMTQFRTIATRYTNQFDYEYVFVDVSPSLGLLNRAVLTSCDAFFMPATPDLFSMYGVRNIGQTLLRWKKSYDSLYNAVNPQIKCLFPEKFVQFLGFTIYNARGRKDQPLGIATAHRDYVNKILEEIQKWIALENISQKAYPKIADSIGGDVVWASHNTYPSMAQKCKCPMWLIPDSELDEKDKFTVTRNKQRFLNTREAYYTFSNDLINRI